MNKSIHDLPLLPEEGWLRSSRGGGSLPSRGGAARRGGGSRITIHALLLVTLAACATPGNAPSVPANLRAPAGERLALETAATGVQIYECRAGKWVFRAPEADLFDRAGNKVGTHYAGPTWESNDGSKVVAALTARSDSPNAGAIPWLLLSAKSTAGNGVFGQTKSIQRVGTVGGTTPTEPCSTANAGKVARIAYKATYYFYQ